MPLLDGLQAQLASTCRHGVLNIGSMNVYGGWRVQAAGVGIIVRRTQNLSNFLYTDGTFEDEHCCSTEDALVLNVTYQVDELVIVVSGHSLPAE